PDELLRAALWLNVHPSLLPRWRGAAPMERAILAGDEETGVTIIKLVKELDACPIGPEDDAGAVYARSAEVAANLLRELDGFDFHEQEGEPTYAQKLESSDRELDLTDPDDALRRVRALSPHIGARTELHGRPLTIWKARIDDGKLVPVEVQPSGGRRMTYEEFLRGLR